MKYEQPEMLIYELPEEVITVVSGGTGENGGFGYDTVNEDLDVY